MSSDHVRPRSSSAAALLAVAALTAVSTAGCARPAPGDELVVLAAASTIDAFEAAVADFESDAGIHVRTSFGPTSTLARQAVEGAPAALLLCANTEWADYVAERVPVTRRRVLVGNDLVIVVPGPGPAGTTTQAATAQPATAQAATAQAAMAQAATTQAATAQAATTQVADLLRETDPLQEWALQRIAIADPEAVPAGIYARQALQRLGLWDAVQPRLLPAVDVRAALKLAVDGEADAAFVYGSDAAGSPAVHVAATFDPGLHDPIEYPLLLLAGEGSAAARLFDFLVSERGRAHFLAHGFALPPP